MQVYETTNHYYTVQVRVGFCSKCGTRTVHFASDSHTPICEACSAPNRELVATEQESSSSPMLHSSLYSRWFAQPR